MQSAEKVEKDERVTIHSLSSLTDSGSATTPSITPDSSTHRQTHAKHKLKVVNFNAVHVGYFMVSYLLPLPLPLFPFSPSSSLTCSLLSFSVQLSSTCTPARKRTPTTHKKKGRKRIPFTLVEASKGNRCPTPGESQYHLTGWVKYSSMYVCTCTCACTFL